MTKVQIQLNLAKPLDENFDSLERAHAVFGIFSVKPGDGRVAVEYDASRLTVPEVQAELIKAGVPVSPTIP